MHYVPATGRPVAAQFARPPSGVLRVIRRRGRACVPFQVQASTGPIFAN